MLLRRKQIFIEKNGNKILIGEIKGNTFYRVVKKSEHFFRKNEAWGIEYDVFMEKILPFVKTVCILDIEEKLIYKTPALVFAELAIKYEFKGHKLQLFLPVKHFRVVKYENPNFITQEVSKKAEEFIEKNFEEYAKTEKTIV